MSDQYQAAIAAAAEGQARAERALEAVQTKAAAALAEAEAVAKRIDAAHDQIRTIRQAAEGADLTDAQAGRVHLLTLDATDLAELQRVKQREAVAVQGSVQTAQNALNQAMTSVQQARAAAMTATMRATVERLEENFCRAIVELYRSHIESGGLAHFPSVWRPSEVLRRMAVNAALPMGQ